VDDGYIKLHRKLLDSYIAAMPPGQRWVALTIFLMANWQDRKWVLNGKVVPVHRGEFVTSVRRLAEAAGVSNSCVVRALKVLKDGGTIGVKPEQRCTRITVLNFARYNDRDSEGETIAERQRDDSGTIASDNRRREEGKKGRKKTPHRPPRGLSAFSEEELSIGERVLEKLSKRAGHTYGVCVANMKPIARLLRDPETPATEHDMRIVVWHRWKKWKGTEQAEYLRPTTLFGPDNFFGKYLPPARAAYAKLESDKHKSEAPVLVGQFGGSNGPEPQ
jgi:uncharacterized phage protein (TIGR02220 family)